MVTAVLMASPVEAQRRRNFPEDEIRARRECMAAIRERGLSGYALANPRFERTPDGSSLGGDMVQGRRQVAFTCLLSRSGTVIDLTLEQPPN